MIVNLTYAPLYLPSHQLPYPILPMNRRAFIHHSAVGVAVAALPQLRSADLAPVQMTSDPKLTGYRAALLEKFATHVHGREPLGLTVTSSWNSPASGTHRATLKVTSSLAGSKSRELSVALHLPPGAAPSAPVPCVLLLDHRGWANMEPAAMPDQSYWPLALIHAAGWAAAAIDTTEIVPDLAADAARDPGILSLDTGLRDASRPGAVSAWAWGASRAADALTRHSMIDGTRLAVIGHSRSGKAALLAAARDERFAAVGINQSGCGGVAHTATKVGERIAELFKNFPHWFAPAWNDYAGREASLPVDQHLLLACVAPRLAFVNSATQDQWADPAAEFRSCQFASAIWELHGRRGLAGGNLSSLPAPDTGLLEGSLAYHLRTGEHDLGVADWKPFLSFLKARLAV